MRHDMGTHGVDRKSSLTTSIVERWQHRGFSIHDIQERSQRFLAKQDSIKLLSFSVRDRLLKQSADVKIAAKDTIAALAGQEGSLSAPEISKNLGTILGAVMALAEQIPEIGLRTANSHVYETQVQGAIALIEGNSDKGNLVQMDTGEGKTLVTGMAAATLALERKGVHVGETNDYLAERNVRKLGALYEALGLRVALVKSDGTQYAFKNGGLVALEERSEAYDADITYGMVSEFAFDYLRDNREYDTALLRQKRPLHALLLDEVDQSLILDATTAFILEGDPNDRPIFPWDKKPSELYASLAFVGDALTREQQDTQLYEIDEKNQRVNLTPEGMDAVNTLLVTNGILKQGQVLFANNRPNKYGELTPDVNVTPYADLLTYYLDATLKAWTVYKRDIDYSIHEASDQESRIRGDIRINDVRRFTGRVLGSQRFSDGVHQAIEAKEQILQQREGKSIQIDIHPEAAFSGGLISTKSFTAMYGKLGGLSGTLIRKAEQLYRAYGVDVIKIDRHSSIFNRKDDRTERIYATREDKFKAIIDNEIIPRYFPESGEATFQPVLIGLQSPDDVLAFYNVAQNLLRQRIREYNLGKPQEEQILIDYATAENNQFFADKIAEAGKLKHITVTNMAGRGTDILLGPGANEAGGLLVVGEHGSEDIDDQLRGRSGRWEDNGSTVFYTSAQDRFIIYGLGPEKAATLKNGLQDGAWMEGVDAEKIVQEAQRKYDEHNDDTRIALQEEQEVVDAAREALYENRARILQAPNSASAYVNGAVSITEEAAIIVRDTINDLGEKFLPALSSIKTKPSAQIELLTEFAKLCSGKPNDPESVNATLHTINGMLEQIEETEGKSTNPGEFIGRLRLIGRRLYYALPENSFIYEHRRRQILQGIDLAWTNHLADLELIHKSSRLTTPGENPETKFKKRAYESFEERKRWLRALISRSIFSRPMPQVRLMRGERAVDKIGE